MLIGDLFGSRGIPVVSPRGTPTTLTDAAIRVDPCYLAEFASASTVGSDLMINAYFDDFSE
jgi:hypothetical protein